MAVVYTRVIVVMVSVLLLSWGSFANFNPAYAKTSEDTLRNLVDDIDLDIGKQPGKPLADKLEAAKNKLLDAIDELEKDPPDVTASIANISEAQQIIQTAIDDDGFSPIIGKILIKALEKLNDKLDKKVSVCHIPSDNPRNAHTLSISKNALQAHLDHGDELGECFVHVPHDDDDVKKIKDTNKKKNMKNTELKAKLKAFNELKMKFKNEFKEIKKEFKSFFPSNSLWIFCFNLTNNLHLNQKFCVS